MDESGAEGSSVMKKTERSFKGKKNPKLKKKSLIFFSFLLGLLKQWQEILEMIVKRLQLSETYNKVMEEVKTFESNLDRMTSGLKEPQQIFHCKEDLEKHIQSLKVSTLLNAKYMSSNHATFQLHLLKASI